MPTWNDISRILEGHPPNLDQEPQRQPFSGARMSRPGRMRDGTTSQPSMMAGDLGMVPNETTAILAQSWLLRRVLFLLNIEGSRTDIFQLGKVLYLLLTGKFPVLIEVNALPVGLVHIVQRATSAQPEDRYQDVGELLDSLRYYHLSKDPKRNAREALENLALQAEDLLHRGEYRSEIVRGIPSLLSDIAQLEHGAAIEHFDRVPDGLLPIMASEFPDELLPVLRGYATAIEAQVAGYNFSYADAVGRRMRSIFGAAKSADLKRAALRVILVAAVELNRFAAIDIFNRLLVEIKTRDLAIPVAEMLKAQRDRYERIARQVPPDRLHAAIRAVQEDVLRVEDDDDLPF